MRRLDAVAAAEHRNREVGGDSGDKIPVGGAAVALGGSPAVHGHRGGPGIFEHLRERRRVALPVVPSGPHLHRHRNRDRLRHRADHGGRMLRLAHEAAARIVLRDLRHRAAHVDIDDVGAELFDDLRGRRHLFGIAAEDLNRDRPLLLGVLRVLECPIDAADEPLGADHLGHHETAAAMALHETAEGRVGHAGHGGDRERRWEGDGPDFHAISAYPERKPQG